MWKNKGRLVVLGLLGILLCGCGRTAGPEVTAEKTSMEAEETAVEEGNEKKELSLAYVAKGGVSYEDMSEFSGGKLQLNVYSGGALGTEKEMIQGVQAGTISIIACTPAVMTEFVPELAVFDIPGVYSDVEECNQLLKNNLYDWIQQYYNKAGLQLIDIRCTGFRQVTSNRRIDEAENFRGLKLRVMENIYHEAFWQAIGAVTTALDFNKLEYALQQGDVDAQENILSSAVNGGIMKYQDYLVITNHIPYITSYVMNKEIYDSLAEEERDILVQYLHGKSDEALESREDREQELFSVCQDKYGVEIIRLSEAEQVEMRSHNQVVIDLLKNNLGEELVNDYLANIGYSQ